MLNTKGRATGLSSTNISSRKNKTGKWGQVTYVKLSTAECKNNGGVNPVNILESIVVLSGFLTFTSMFQNKVSGNLLNNIATLTYLVNKENYKTYNTNLVFPAVKTIIIAAEYLLESLNMKANMKFYQFEDGSSSLQVKFSNNWCIMPSASRPSTC